MLKTYILNPTGNWRTLPGMCCDYIQKIPIYLHFIGGILVMIIEPFQFLRLGSHKITGTIYIFSCILSAVGGLIFIAFNGTVGGKGMSIPFTIYGILMIIYPLITWYYAKQRNYEQHQKWVIRLFLLENGSMIYRMLNLILCMLLTNCGTVTFKSPLDYIIDWLFFCGPMIIGELYINEWMIKKINDLCMNSVNELFRQDHQKDL